jgi:hypothetical protein
MRAERDGADAFDHVSCSAGRDLEAIV